MSLREQLTGLVVDSYHGWTLSSTTSATALPKPEWDPHGFRQTLDKIVPFQRVDACVSIDSTLVHAYNTFMGSGKLAGFPASWCREMATKDYNHGLVLQEFPVPGEADFSPREDHPAPYRSANARAGAGPPSSYTSQRRFTRGRADHRFELRRPPAAGYRGSRPSRSKPG